MPINLTLEEFRDFLPADRRISIARLRQLCEAGRFPGARKITDNRLNREIWIIPAGTPLPEHLRPGPKPANRK